VLHVQSGQPIPLHTEVLHDGDPEGGQLDSTDGMDLDIAIWRWSGSAIQWWDWDDSSWKALGSVTTLRESLTFIDDTEATGIAYRVWTPPVSTDDYMCEFIIRDDNNIAKNVPQQGQVSVGQWMDQIDDIETDTQDIQSRIPAVLVGGAMNSDVSNMQAGVVDATAIDTDAIDADAIADDAIDAGAIATGAIDADAIAANAITAAKIATDAITSDKIATDAIGADEIAADAIGASELALSALDAIDTHLAVTEGHGTGAWDGTASDWSAAEKEQIRFRLAMDGSQTDPTTAVGTMEDILADTDSLDNTKITTARANNLDEITAARLAELDAANLPSDVDDILADTEVIEPLVSTNLNATVSSREAESDAATRAAADIAAHGTTQTTGGAGPWTTGAGTPLTSQEVRDAMKLAPTGGVAAAGSVDEHLDTIEADTQIIEPLATTNLDAMVSSRAVPGDSMALTAAALTAINTELEVTQGHGAGSWQAAGGLTSQQIRDAMKLAPTIGAPAAGSVDQHLDDIEADTAAIDLRLPADPADESNQLAQHTATQAAIAALNDLDQAAVQAALTAQGYTIVRADYLNASIAGIPAAIEALQAGIHGPGSWESEYGMKLTEM